MSTICGVSGASVIQLATSIQGCIAGRLGSLIEIVKKIWEKIVGFFQMIYNALIGTSSENSQTPRTLLQENMERVRLTVGCQAWLREVSQGPTFWGDLPRLQQSTEENVRLYARFVRALVDNGADAFLSTLREGSLPYHRDILVADAIHSGDVTALLRELRPPSEDLLNTAQTIETIEAAPPHSSQ